MFPINKRKLGDLSLNALTMYKTVTGIQLFLKLAYKYKTPLDPGNVQRNTNNEGVRMESY